MEPLFSALVMSAVFYLFQHSRKALIMYHCYALLVTLPNSTLSYLLAAKRKYQNKKDMLLFSSHHTIFCLLSIRYHSYWLTHVTPSRLFIQCKTFLNYDKYKKYTWL